MKTHIIYIPGLGDRYDSFRSRALKLWRLWGVTTQHVPSVWYDGGSMYSKLARIKNAIDDVPKDTRIILIGESAGATLALHSLAGSDRITRVITLCGVARNFTPISGYLRRRAPALDEAVNTLPDEFRSDIHSVRAAIDGVVGSKYSSTSNAKRHVIWSVGHLTTIVLCLTIYAPIITAIAKKQ